MASNTVTSGADDRRASIVKAAANLFSQKGYHQTSMEDIAEAVGLRKPTLYWYISCKEEILHLIHDDFMDQLMTRHNKRMESNMSSAEMLREIMVDIFEQITEKPGYILSFHEHYRELTDEIQEVSKIERDRYYHMVVDVVRKGMENGEFAPGNPSLVALAFFGMSNWIYKWYSPNGAMTPHEIADVFWDLFMNGAVNKQQVQTEDK